MPGLTIFKQSIIAILILFIGVEVSLTITDIIPDTVVEMADLGETGKEADQKEEKKKDDLFSKSIESRLNALLATDISHLSTSVYSEVFRVIPTPPPNC